MDNEPSPATGATPRRRRLLASFAALAAASGAASAQMGGGRHGGGQGRASEAAPAKPAADCPKPEPTLPRDLMAVFATRLRPTPPQFALQPPQARAFDDFVESVQEVGQHDERWIERTLAQGVGTVSAAEPLRSFIGAESADADDRAQALQDLLARHKALVALLDDRQRAALSTLFVTTREDLRADSRG